MMTSTMRYSIGNNQTPLERRTCPLRSRIVSPINNAGETSRSTCAGGDLESQSVRLLLRYNCYDGIAHRCSWSNVRHLICCFKLKIEFPIQHFVIRTDNKKSDIRYISLNALLADASVDVKYLRQMSTCRGGISIQNRHQ